VENNPLISVIMPAYNCENYIREAIDSVLNQTYRNIELLVADDGSTDGTKKIIDSYTDPRLKKMHNAQNLGYLKTSNLLAAQCMGDYMSFQDADDSCTPDRFEIFLKEFNADPDLACVGSFANRMDENGKELGVIQLKCSNDEIKKDLPQVFNCIGSALMVKKNVITRLGLYDAYFDRCGSEDLYWYGIVAHQYKTINVPRALYNYRLNPQSVSGDKNKSPKKQMSKEFASYFLDYFYKTGSYLLQNKYRLRVLENFLIGKCLCWNRQYRSGIKKIMLSIILNPFGYTERYHLLRVYLPKIASNRG
jgi:glycosyltransferase involved in cell wall biosynthesis